METEKMQKNPSAKRNRSILKAIASGFIWGLGQLLNKQYLKAVLFFVIFAGFIGIELGTSKYFQKTDPYDKITGQDFVRGERNQFLPNFISLKYTEARDSYSEHNLPESFRDFDERFFKNGRYVLNTEQELIDFIAYDLVKQNPTSYNNIFTPSNKIIIERGENGEDIDPYLKSRQYLALKEVLYRDSEQLFYRERNYQVDGNEVKDYVEVNFTTGEEVKYADDQLNVVTSVAGFSKYEKTGASYIIGDKLYVAVKVDFTDDPNIPVYMNVFDSTEEPIFILPDGSTQVTNKGPLYSIDGSVYEYVKPGLVYNGVRKQFVATPFTKVFTDYMHYRYNQIGNAYTNDDYTRLVIKIHLAMHPEERATFEREFDNFFYDKAGLFVRSYWGVFTLGTTKKIEFREYAAFADALTMHNGTRFVDIDESHPVLGHVSTHVLLEGLIGVILSLFFFIFMIWSIVDAYRTSEKIYKEEEVLGGTEYFKEVYESSFEYIVLSPALFVLAFISIMPIIFGFLLAFTSISGKQSMIDTFDYVGFKNFFALFNFTDGFGASFGKAFWRVLLWTIIWAVFSTGTVFFGGLFQALILNSERVQFKRFWRTILILPWAMPALLSQMVFSVMFGETGFINNLFRQVGLYDLFMKLGWLGRDFSMLEGVEKLFYIGRDNIQWFTNPFNPTFVKIILIIVNIWLGFPYFMALMSGIMTAIDKSLYEAADIDGATKWQKLRYITMPLILYSTAPILIMTFSGNFNNFGVIYFITGGGPNAGSYSRGFAGDTDILISWMYKLTVDESIYNIASVFSVLIFIFVGSITAWNLSRTRAFKED
ncbi:MAG TPA: ABC transporter permease subunit [Acholeplasmataceae bacterium]|jgi:arabinogalactan oligomer/maltooligosaccharide transport system permease protein|nr:ABC transporter permease subunit [Acholeplasmataceae bacterium]